MHIVTTIVIADYYDDDGELDDSWDVFAEGEDDAALLYDPDHFEDLIDAEGFAEEWQIEARRQYGIEAEIVRR